MGHDHPDDSSLRDRAQEQIGHGCARVLWFVPHQRLNPAFERRFLVSGGDPLGDREADLEKEASHRRDGKSSGRHLSESGGAPGEVEKKAAHDCGHDRGHDR